MPSSGVGPAAGASDPLTESHAMLRHLIVGGLAATLAAASTAGAQLQHYYDFTSSANDQVGTAHGSLAGNATVAGGVLTLDGSGDYVQFASHVVPTSGSYTVSLLARQGAAAGNFGYYSELVSQGSSGGPGFYIGTYATNGMRATDSWIPAPGSFLTDGLFHRYTLVVDAGANDSYFYVDGALQGARGFAIATTAGGDHTRLGAQFGGYGEYFRGDLDEVRIYGNALSAQQVATIDLASVPEPGSWALVATGLAGVAGVARRRRTTG